MEHLATQNYHSPSWALAIRNIASHHLIRYPRQLDCINEKLMKQTEYSEKDCISTNKYKMLNNVMSSQQLPREFPF